METTVERFNADLISECAHLAAEAISLRESLQKAQEENQQQSATIKQLESKLALAHSNAELERLKVELMTKQLFGSRTERRKVAESEFLDQLRFSFMTDVQESPEDSQEEEVEVAAHTRKQKKRSKAPNPTREVRFPDNLPRSTIEVEPADKTCPCCQKEMTHEKKVLITEKLCCSRDPFYVEQYRRPVYACRSCEKVAPTQPVPEVFQRSCLSESMVAFVVVAKFLYSLPLYRQAKMYKGWGVTLSDSLLVRHCLKSYELLEPIISSLKDRVFSSDYILADETRLRAYLTNEKTKEKAFKHGYLWGMLNEEQELYYEFTASRTHASCLSVFDGYEGVVICDAYDGYDALAASSNVRLAHCNYHARRKWHQSLKYDKKLANEALDFYKLFSEVERECKDMPPDQRREVRQKKAVPIWEAFDEWLTQNCELAPPKTPIKKANEYCRRRWSTLRAYLDDGRIPISTNELEAKMKHIAVGRKNFNHASSKLGAKAVAGLYSLVLTCELQGEDPFYYLADVLRRVGEHPASKVEELTPTLWKERFLDEAKERYQAPHKVFL